MGCGYCFLCRKCKKEYAINLGSGMAFLQVFEDTKDEIKKGLWGKEYRELINSTPLAVPDIEDELYICKSCGKWIVTPNMSIYVPNDPNEILHKQDGIKTVKEWGGVPVMRWKLKEDYHLLKRYIHICECGKRLHKATFSEIMNLACPHCGTVNEVTEFMEWD